MELINILKSDTDETTRLLRLWQYTVFYFNRLTAVALCKELIIWQKEKAIPVLWKL